MEFTIIDANYNLQDTIEGGQIFRYDKVDDHRYTIYSEDKRCTIEKVGDTIRVYQVDEDGSAVNFWHRYFNFDQNLATLDALVRDNSFLTQVVQESHGVHLLRQPSWETLVCFIISQQNNISRIKKCVGELTEAAGYYDFKRDFTYFPTPQNVLSTNLNGLGLGYRADYIHSAAVMVKDSKIKLDELHASKCSYDKAMQRLTDIYGVGVKVANCVCLFGLDFVDAFPVDIHIKRVLQLPEMSDFNPAKYQGYLGLLQQYLYTYTLKHHI